VFGLPIAPSDSVRILKRQRKHAKVEPQVANVIAVPALDQATFEQMLEAAFILQQESRRVQKKLDPSATLVEIAEAQELLRSLSDVSAAAKVIVERLERVTSATAIAVAFLRNDHVEYCGAAGTSASLAGSIIPAPANITALLQKNKGHNLSPKNLRYDHLQGNTPNPILFPFYDKTSMVGFLQLDFPETESVPAHQMQSCHVMANLMGEAVVRVAEFEWKQALAKEHAAVLEALGRLKPQLERLTVDSSNSSPSIVQASPEPSAAPAFDLREPSPEQLPTEDLPDISDLLAQLATPGLTAVNLNPAGSLEHKGELVAANASAVEESQSAETGRSDSIESNSTAQLSSACGQCGFLFSEGESFCGRCGTPRSIEFSPTLELLSAPGTLAEAGSDPQPASKFLLEGEVAPAVVHEMPIVSDLGRSLQAPPAIDGNTALAIEPPAEAEAIGGEQNSQLRVLMEHEKSAWQSPWTSAAKARTWLESVKNAHASRRWLGRHQGDVSVAISVLVLLLAVLWWSPHQAAPKPRVKSAEPTLSLFERALVGLGLAQPPTVAPSFGGNPNAEVWEDVHTALYYCAGSEQYEKTQGGKVATQRDAQLDQFEPATRKACE